MAQKQTLTRIIAGMGLCHSDQDDILQDLSIKVLNANKILTVNRKVDKWIA